MIRLLIVLAAGLAVGAVVAAGVRRGALIRLTLAALLPLAAIWGAGYRVMRSGWRDIDGWVDCWPHCHAWHHVGAVWFWAPPLAAAVLVLVAAVVAVRRARRP